LNENFLYKIFCIVKHTTQMLETLIAIEGDAIISLTDNYDRIMFCGSLTDVYFVSKPPHYILDTSRYNFKPDDYDLHKYKIVDHFDLCEMKVYIISSNTLLLRYYEKKDEDNFIGFSIDYNELLKIAKNILCKY